MPYRYRSADEDSGRCQDFPFRSDDIVISTRSKSGTTSMLMICALLHSRRKASAGHGRLLYHQSANLNRERIAELTGQPVAARRAPLPLGQWLLSWTESDVDPREQLDSLPGVMWHLADAWDDGRTAT